VTRKYALLIYLAMAVAFVMIYFDFSLGEYFDYYIFIALIVILFFIDRAYSRQAGEGLVAGNRALERRARRMNRGIPFCGEQ
jgi:hypothetical protein